MRFAATVLLAGLCLSAKAQSLLVVNQWDATLSVIDPERGVQLKAFPEKTPGLHAHEVASTPDGQIAFLPIYASVGLGKVGVDGHEMIVVDVHSGSILAHVDFGHPVRPHDPVYDPVRQLLYVTTELDKSVAIIDPKTYKIVGSVPTEQPQSHMLVLSHDGKRGYTANVEAGTVSVLDLIGRKTVAVIRVSSMVQRISVSHDDKYVFTADQTSPRLAVINTATNYIDSWIDLPGSGYGTGLTPDDKTLVVAVPSINEVAVVDFATRKVTHRFKVPPEPQEVLVRPDGKVAYISCRAGNKVVALDLTSWKITQMIDAGSGPDGLGWAE